MKRHVINSPHPFVTFLWHFLVQLSHCENLVLHLDSGSFWSTTLKIGCLWRWFTNTLSWTGQNYTVVTFKPSLQLLVSESRSTQFLLTAAFCSSFPHSLPPMHQFVKLTMACHFRTCQNSSLHLLPLWISHSSSSPVLLSSLPCLSAAACLFLSAYLLCDRYIFWIFSHACMKSCVCFWVTPYFQDMALQWYSWKTYSKRHFVKYRGGNFNGKWYGDDWCFVGTQLFENHVFSCQAVRNAKPLGKFQV